MNRRAATAGRLLLAGLLLAGCSAETRQRWLPVLFDGVPEEGRPAPPPTHRVRRDLQRENEELRREVADLRAAAQARADAGRRAGAERPAEQARSWAEAQERLPRDPDGATDWARALQSGAVAPRPGVDPGAPAQGILDLDVRLARGGHPFFAATFRHATHTAWVACGSCHPAPFPLASGTPRPAFGMAALRAGRGCGVCHGPVAFGVDRGCARCHPQVPAAAPWTPPPPAAPLEAARTWAEAAARLPATAGTPDWEAARAAGLLAPRPGRDPAAAADTLDVEVERVPKEDATMKVVFRHAIHTAWLVCDSCHPALFEMEGGATPISMEMLYRGERCGACHGSVAFPVEACGRCHPSLGG